MFIFPPLVLQTTTSSHTHATRKMKVKLIWSAHLLVLATCPCDLVLAIFSLPSSTPSHKPYHRRGGYDILWEGLISFRVERLPYTREGCLHSGRETWVVSVLGRPVGFKLTDHWAPHPTSSVDTSLKHYRFSVKQGKRGDCYLSCMRNLESFLG